MKKYFFVAFFIFCFYSCKKDNLKQEEVSKFVIIGDYSNPDLFFKNISIDSVKEITDLDLNNDGRIDLNIGSEGYSSPNGSSGSGWIESKDSLFEFVIQKNNRNLKIGDTISNNMEWRQGSFIVGYSYVFIPNGINEHYINWSAGDSAYIGIRYLKNNNHFSWIKVLNGGTIVKEYGIFK